MTETPPPPAITDLQGLPTRSSPRPRPPPIPKSWPKPSAASSPPESAELANKLVQQTIARQGVPPGQLSIHAGNGLPMTSKTLALKLTDLGVTKSHGRPCVSDDNPFSESQCRTMTYRPDFPECFGSLEDARAHRQAFLHSSPCG